MGGDLSAPFGSSWVVHLRPFFMTDATVNVASPGNTEPQVFRLVLQQTFADIHEMAEVGINMKIRKFAKQAGCRRRCEHRTSAMRFVIDLQADTTFKLKRFGEESLLNIKRPPVLAAMDGDFQRI